jgi:hypothetical protein
VVPRTELEPREKKNMIAERGIEAWSSDSYVVTAMYLLAELQGAVILQVKGCPVTCQAGTDRRQMYSSTHLRARR